MLMEMITDAHPAPDQHQSLITSRVSPLAHSYHVWSTSVSTFVSYPAHRQNERQTDSNNRMTPPWRSNKSWFGFASHHWLVVQATSGCVVEVAVPPSTLWDVLFGNDVDELASAICCCCCCCCSWTWCSYQARLRSSESRIYWQSG